MDILLGWPITNWLITNQQLHEACKWTARGSLDDDLLSCLHVWVVHFHVCWKNGAGHWEIPCSLFGGIPINKSVILGMMHFRTDLRNLAHATLIDVPATCSAIFSRVACATEKCSFQMEVSLAMTLSGRGELKFSVKLRETDSSRGSLDDVDIRCSTCSPGHFDTFCQVKKHNSVGIQVIRPHLLNV